ncbi:MAG TPA: hypothetical protein VN025_09545 [Candidatus Dormibacteraeota bacterium]|jgi:hypothetical protein|nr:hypothetical protein [Candidatus Dormibacteraeota bacterium]
MDFLFALLLSLVPPRYRRSDSHGPGALLIQASGITAFVEIVLVCILYAKGFVDYIPNATIGPAAFLEYFFTWQGLILAFFFLDGAVRLLAAVAGQAIGTIPLYAIAWIDAWFERRSMQKRQCPLVPDVVTRTDASGKELRIASCRPRKNWDKWMTVMYEEKLYEISGAELGDATRPHVYFLRPKPESKVIRGLHRYHPDEVFALGED